MPILFSAVAYKKRVLAKHASCDGNFMEIAEEVLQKIPSTNGKMTYSHGQYLFHYIIDSQHFYFCVTSKKCQRSRAFLFLNEIQRRFSHKESESFCKVLADEMYRYSEDYNTITIRNGELDEINSIGVGCSETLLGEKILFVKNPEVLNYTIISNVSQPAQTPETIASIETTESRENSNFTYYVIVTVILILMWLVMSMSGPTSLVMVACVCLFVIAKSPKSKDDS